MSGADLENLYRERFEEDVIFALKDRFGLTCEQAMRIFYRSKAARHLYEMPYAIHYAGPEMAVDLIAREIDCAEVKSALRAGEESAEPR